MGTSNAAIAKLLRGVSAALSIKKRNIFEIRAYENVADVIEHLTAEVHDLWEEKRLGNIPGVGKNIQSYLDEYFRTGKVEHFKRLSEGIKPAVFEFLEIPGVGPKTALDLAELGIKGIEDLRGKVESEELLFKQKITPKLQEKLSLGLTELSGLGSRMLLPFASSQAVKILEYLKGSKDVVDADPLGSLRRMVSAIGDLDFAVASNNPQAVINHFVKMPGIKEIISHGEAKASIVLNSGIHVDILVGSPNTYGALLQHFTGSKHHNIHLREVAQANHLSLSEYGVKNTKSGKIVETKTEEEFYKLLGMQTPPPEIREDTGEIEAALAYKLPDLVTYNSIKGDLHLHSNFPLEPSHGPGVNPIEEIARKGKELGYKYVGISDHSPSFTNHSKEDVIRFIEKRTKYIQKLNKSKKSVRVLNALEIDILGDGSLSVPDEALQTLDYCIAGIHSGHRTSKELITKRMLNALESPYVDIISHPTGRLINERGSYEADWEVIFKFAAKNKKLLEINAFPNRLDLRDDLVRLALKHEVKFVINTDAHEISQMENMPYGVAVARRGWVTSTSIVNTWDWTKFAEWFNIS